MRKLHQLTTIALLGSGMFTALSAQPRVVPIKVITRPGSIGYNDCWGYTTPDKRDFALLGDQDGLMLIEATDETNITQKGWWTANRNGWRDFTNYKQYIYSVSEGHRGIRIIDMSNPDRPVDRGYVATSSISHTHNISVDPATGKLYLSGTNQGVAIFDAKANPRNPALLEPGAMNTSTTSAFGEAGPISQPGPAGTFAFWMPPRVQTCPSSATDRLLVTTLTTPG